MSKSVDFSQTSCFSEEPVVDEAIPHSVNSEGGAIVGAGVAAGRASPLAMPHASRQDVPLPPSTPQISKGFVTSMPNTGTPTSSCPASAFSSSVLTAFMSSSVTGGRVCSVCFLQPSPSVMLQKGPPPDPVHTRLKQGSTCRSCTLHCHHISRSPGAATRPRGRRPPVGGASRSLLLLPGTILVT